MRQSIQDCAKQTRALENSTETFLCLRPPPPPIIASSFTSFSSVSVLFSSFPIPRPFDAIQLYWHSNNLAIFAAKNRWCEDVVRIIVVRSNSFRRRVYRRRWSMRDSNVRTTYDLMNPLTLAISSVLAESKGDVLSGIVDGSWRRSLHHAKSIRSTNKWYATMLA